MTELSDQTLLAYWYRNRNAEAFHVLASRHARMVYATALRVLRDVQAAEDVSQESFLALAQAKRPPSRNVAAWLHRTAYHAALDVIRSRKRRDARDIEYSKAQPGAAHIAWDDIRELVDEAVMALPETSREPLVRYFFEQESHAAIAIALGIPRQTVTHRIGKGIEQVRRRLKEKGVIVPASAALVTLIQENSAQAMPTAILQEVGRTALVATPSMWAVLGSYTSGAGFKVAAAVLVVGVGWTLIQFAGDGPSAASNLMDGHIVSESPNLGFVSATETPRSDLALVSTSASLQEVESDVESTTDEAGGSEASPTDSSRLASAAGVVTLADGRTFSDANVRLINVEVLADHRYPEDTLFEVKTDAHGRFEQTDMPPAEYSLMVTEPADNSWGAANEFMRITLVPGEQRKDLNIVFGTEGNLTVSGTVVDGEGRPLNGVRLYTFGPGPRAAMTDAQGRFTLRYLSGSDVKFHADKVGYSGTGTTVPAGTQDVQLTMYVNGAISGRVIDAKTRKPVTHFKASFMNGHRPSFQESMFGNSIQFDHPGGEFELPQVYVGEVTVVARAAGYAPAMAQVVVEPGSTLRDVTLELDRASAKPLSGIVVSEDGTPIAGARIYTDRIAPPDSRDINVVAESGAGGLFTVEKAPPDTPFFAAWHPDYAPSSSSVTDNTTIVLKRAARLNVEVLSQGRPMPRIEIRTYFLNAPNVGYIGGGVTDSNGRVLVAEVIPGKAIVAICLPFDRMQHKVVSFAPGEEKSVQFEVIPGEASIEGTAYNDGEPVAGGEVSLFVEAETGSELFKRKISADGTFEIRDVPTGTAQLIAVGEDYKQRTRIDGVQLSAGESTTLAVDLTPTCRVTGDVADLHIGDVARLTFFQGAMDTQAAISAASQSWFGPDFLGMRVTDGTKPYELTLHTPGAYTILLTTFKANNIEDSTDHESRVIEVSADEDLVVDFQLTY